MTTNRSGATEFHEGEQIVMAEGTYQGTPGVFVRLRQDPNWADIAEPDGSVQSHPVAWLAHSADTIPGSRN